MGAYTEEQKSDLGGLWGAAVAEYNAKRLKDKQQPLQLAPFRSMDEVIRGTDNTLTNFKDFRNDGSKVAKVRTVFKNNLWLIQKAVNTIQILGNAASAFPPAMPAALIFSAFGQVMQSFGQVSADYDKVVGFFEFSHRFFDRLSIIEDYKPDQIQFDRCVIRVFSSMLVICATAQDYAKEKRGKHWLKTLFDGSDGALAGAYKTMESAVLEFDQTVNLTTLKVVEITSEIIRTIDGKVDFIMTSMTVVREYQEVILENQKEASGKQDKTLELLSDTSGKTHEMLRNMQAQLQKLQPIQEKEKAKPPATKSKTDPADRKRRTLKEVTDYYKAQFWGWESMMKEVKAQRSEIRNAKEHGMNSSKHRDATGVWLLDEPELQTWKAGDVNRLLWIRGSAGIGKTFLAETVVANLEQTLEERHTSAYFFFHEEQDVLTSWENAILALSAQVAEKDSNYCEHLAFEISRDGEDRSRWSSCFLSRFPRKEDNGHVYLVLDGIDEMKGSERTKLCRDLEELVKSNSNIHIALVSRPALPEVEALSPSIIDLTKDKLSTDMQKVIIAGCRTLPRLKKFRKPVKNTILRKMKAQADGMRYVEHMLRRLNYIGRESAVLKDLDRKLPADLESVYKLMLAECQKDRTKEQYKTLKRLFAWLAYSKRPLTLTEASQLVALTVGEDGSFDVEEELIGRSARILDLAKVDDDDDDDAAADKEDDSDAPDDTHETTFKDSGNITMTFQERSLREYFQAVDVDEHGLRTPPRTAHLTIFEMTASRLLAGCDRPNFAGETNLLDYSARFWIRHFIEIDPNDATDKEVKIVLDILRAVFQNTNNVARTLEYYSPAAYSNMLPGNDLSWLKNVESWVHRGLNLAQDFLTLETLDWVKNFAIEKAFLLLAHGHVENWFKEHFARSNITCLKFLRDALVLSGVDVSANDMATIDKILRLFPDIEQDAGCMRALSFTVHVWGLYDDAIKYAEQGLNMLPPGRSSIRFYLGVSLYQSTGALGKAADALSVLEETLNSLPLEWESEEDLPVAVKNVYLMKAAYLRRLEPPQPDEAVEAFKAAGATQPSGTVDGWLLEETALVYDETNDPNRSKLLALLKSWNQAELNAWFDDIGGDTSRLNFIVANHGTEEKDFVLRCFDSYINSLPPRSDKIVIPQACLANMYRRVLNEPQEARKLYTSILQRKILNPDEPGVMEYISEARLDMSDMIFDEFRNSKDRAEKKALLVEIKQIASPKRGTADWAFLRESSISVAVALMTRAIGSAMDYEDILQNAFESCIINLSDSVGWNDSDTLRLLSRILCCVGGLERDAMIAISCQFSKVTEEITEPSAISPAATSAIEVEAVNSLEEEKPADATTNGEVQTLEALVVATSREADLKQKTVAIIEVEIDVAEGQVPTSEIHLPSEVEGPTATEQKDFMANGANPIVPSKGESLTTSDQHNGEVDVINTTAAVEGKSPAAAEQQKDEKVAINAIALPALEDEDLFNEYPVTCDGECGTSYYSFTEPIHLCVFCPCVDLCSGCYEKRIAQNAGETDPYWRSYCGKNHRYLKGPVPGWKGVKNGIIRIEGPDGEVEKIAFKEWLRGLKEERWVEAWKKFWRDSADVKDVIY